MGALDKNRVQGDAEVSGVLKARAVREQLAHVTVSSLYQIPVRAKGIYELTTSPTNDVVRLPDATLVEDGWSVKVINAAASTVNLVVENFTGVPLIELLPGEYFEFQLLEGSIPSGSWYSIFMQESDHSTMPTVPCDPSIAVGEHVYIDASGVAQRGFAGGSASQAKVVGIVVAKPLVARARLAQWGVAEVVGSLSPGDDVYVSATTPGAVVGTMPSVAGQYVKFVGKALTATTILVDSSSRPILRS